MEFVRFLSPNLKSVYLVDNVLWRRRQNNAQALFVSLRRTKLSKIGVIYVEVITKAIDLMQYTYSVTANKKRYPAKYKMLIERIQNECMNIYDFLMSANRIQINAEKQKRLDLQTRSISSCDKLSCYVELSMNLSLIGSDTVEYWQKKICDVKYMTIAWRSKDKTR